MVDQLSHIIIYIRPVQLFPFSSIFFQIEFYQNELWENIDLFNFEINIHNKTSKYAKNRDMGNYHVKSITC